MSSQADVPSNPDGGRYRRVLATAIVIAMITALVAAVSHFVALPTIVIAFAAGLWILSLVVAVFIAAASGKGFWSRIGAAFKMLGSWIFYFG